MLIESDLLEDSSFNVADLVN